MPLYLNRLIVILALAAAGGAHAQKKVQLRNIPDWVTPVGFDAAAIPDESMQAGYYYLLVDEQENTVRQELFQHYAYKVFTPDGIQEMSDISIDFDPSFQKLIIHRIQVHRNGKVIDQRSPDIRTIQREESMDRYLYDGTMTAVVNLKDIRVGDIIEYAFTRTGYNPVFDGHLFKKIYFTFGVPYEKLFQRLVVPNTTSLRLEPRNTDIGATIEKKSNTTEYTWNRPKTDALVTDSNTPDWYDAGHHTVVSDFGDWDEVAAWASRHFTISTEERQKLGKAISGILEYDDPEEYTLRAIRFVQDEIRYLGFEGGLNSHKPHSPVKVLEQRFGDCKDKSLLLAEILRLKNIEASPVLVNTVLRDRVEKELPALSAFNHCVVQIRNGAWEYYIDPTINNQGGNLETNYFPAYGKGLIVDSSTSELTHIPPPGTSDISEEQKITVTSLTGEAYLEVRTTYTGGQADYIRGEFSTSNLEAVQKNYQTFYGNLYPDIEVVRRLTTSDHRESNIFSIEETYKIPTFWKKSESSEQIMYCEVYPQTMEGYFNVSKSTSRTAPYRLSHPLSYNHSIHIKMPEDWNVEPAEELIETDFYSYKYSVNYKDQEISLRTHYNTKANHVPVEAFAQFVADHGKMMDNLSFQISFNKGLMANEKGISWMGLIAALLSLAIAIVAALRIYYFFDPQPSVLSGNGIPIGGWLVLVALGICISPFRLTYDLFNLPEVYDRQMWANLIVLERYGLWAFVLFEHIYNIFYLVFSVLMAILFFKRRSSFPRLFLIYLAVISLVTVADVIVGLQIEVTDSERSTYFKEMTRAIIAAAIWIPYFRMSSRVRETFVTRVNNDDNDNDIYYAPAVTAESYSSSSENGAR